MNTRSRSAATVAVCAATVLGAIGLTPVAATAAPSVPAPKAKAESTADYNGDGFADIAIGAPNAKINGVAKAGAVTVMFGSATGYRNTGGQTVSRADAGVPGDPKTDERWGQVDDGGDLNGDGYDDLLVRNHWTSSWTVLWGAKQGLSGGVELRGGEGTTASPRFYNTVAIGDYNGDGAADLASTANVQPLDEPFDSAKYALMLLNGPFDRSGKPAEVVIRYTEVKDNKYAPASLATSDITGDGIDDLITNGSWRGSGSPYLVNAGMIYRGSAKGLVPGTVVKGQGWASASGDINKDGYPDFVSGQDMYLAAASGGSVRITYGGPKGTSTTLKPQTFTQDTPGVPGVNEKDDRFGAAVDLGDVNGDGYADVVIGAPWEDGTEASTNGSGSVTVLLGSAKGVTTNGAQLFTQNTKGVPSTSESRDQFGDKVHIAKAANGRTEVLVGGFGEDRWVGRVWRLPTNSSGVTGTGSTSVTAKTLSGLGGAVHFGEFFSR